MSLEEQLATRKLVDRAKGKLMDDYGMKEGDAFNFIQKTAMNERAKKGDIAQRIIDGELQPPPAE
jgi:response regulator NasT